MIKSPVVNIQSLIDIITKDSIIHQHIQDIRFKAPTILQLRLEQLLQGGIADFNTQIFYISSLPYNPYKDRFDKAINNILKDFQMLRLIVYFYFSILSGFFLLIFSLASI